VARASRRGEPWEVGNNLIMAETAMLRGSVWPANDPAVAR